MLVAAPLRGSKTYRYLKEYPSNHTRTHTLDLTLRKEETRAGRLAGFTMAVLKGGGGDDEKLADAMIGGTEVDRRTYVLESKYSERCHRLKVEE
jgi:hypothetical protein